MYHLIASNLEQAQKKRNTTKAPVPDKKLSKGDSILLKDDTARLGTLDITETIILYPFPETLKVRSWIQKVKWK